MRRKGEGQQWKLRSRHPVAVAESEWPRWPPATVSGAPEATQYSDRIPPHQAERYIIPARGSPKTEGKSLKCQIFGTECRYFPGKILQPSPCKTKTNTSQVKVRVY